MRFRGVLGSAERLDALVGQTQWGGGLAEGLVIRTLDGSAPRVAKYVAAAWKGIGSAPWAGENTVAATRDPPQ